MRGYELLAAAEWGLRARGAICVFRPDHPFLLGGPDLLAGGDGPPLAAFLPAGTPRTMGYRLRARLALARTALPRRARLVALAGPDELGALGPDFPAFAAGCRAEILDPALGPGALLALLSAPGIPADPGEGDAARAAYDLAGRLMDAAAGEPWGGGDPDLALAGLLTEGWAPCGAGGGRVPGNGTPRAARRGDALALAMPRAACKPAGLRDALAAAMALQTPDTPRARVALLGRIPVSPGDRLRPRRAAALAGWALCAAPDAAAARAAARRALAASRADDRATAPRAPGDPTGGRADDGRPGDDE